MSEEQARALREVLAKKVKIYAEGAKKRGRFDEAAWAVSLTEVCD